MRYCWWHAALQIGGDGCHNFAHLFHSSSPSEFDIFLEEVPILVTAAQNAILMARASEEEEVRTAVLVMHPEKALGPDMMTTFFYQQSWTIIREDVVNMVNNFLNLFYSKKMLDPVQ
ncbi:unnamed protein product [Brassica oleracea var. botrytis]